jgi:hypothetical protein
VVYCDDCCLACSQLPHNALQYWNHRLNGTPFNSSVALQTFVLSGVEFILWTNRSCLRTYIHTYPTQGMNFKAGVWHHPLVALDAPCDIACLVYEDGVEGDDCHIVNVCEADQVLVHVGAPGTTGLPKM